MADHPRYLVEIHPKTGEYAARDTVTGRLLDIVELVRLLNGERLDG